MWQVHEIENLFIDPLIVFETLHFLGYLEAQDSVEMITVALKSAATDLRDWMAADWVAWEFDQTLQLPSRRIAGDTPKTSLQKYAAALQSRIVAATDMGNLESRFQEKCIAIDTLLAGDSWLQRLPGKQLLRKLLAPYPSLSPEQYLRSAAGVVLDRKIQIPELERLKDVLRQVPMSMIK